MSSFQTFRENLPSPAESLAILLGCAEITLFGLVGLANPREFAKAYGLPIGATEKARALEEGPPTRQVETALVSSIAVRNVEKGVLLLTLGLYVQDRRALGVAVAAGVVTTLADSLIVRAYGVREAVWGHVFGVVNCMGIGAGLLLWKRGDPWW